MLIFLFPVRVRFFFFLLLPKNKWVGCLPPTPTHTMFRDPCETVGCVSVHLCVCVCISVLCVIESGYVCACDS